MARAAKGIVEHTGLNAGLVGAVLMGLVNALPETVTSIAAVRRGAVTPAVAAVIGGDGRDALDLVVGDAAYRGGSLFHAAHPDERWTSGSSPAARWSWRRSCSAVSSSAGGAAG
nr:hypothetical protein [Streptomyces sp. NRRL F-2305]